MQVLFVDGKKVQVKRAHQTSIGAALIIETPEGKYIYKNGEEVPPTQLVAAGISAFKPEEILFDKTYNTVNRATYAMVQKGVADRQTRKSTTHKVVETQDGYIIRKIDEEGEAINGSPEMPEV